ncbi:hypothetical protein TPAR_00006 [Tolypocladium paradoxum]|uniref:Uncharacterized protein n=1 Tax=Tolypocladium paradoxum TaxID=94208 RepID=A0A2S4LBI4_9HYPO|nr:hypothetical protein TPAR_00006 [Tolypocladium paradoxum]
MHDASSSRRGVGPKTDQKRPQREKKVEGKLRDGSANAGDLGLEAMQGKDEVLTRGACCVARQTRAVCRGGFGWENLYGRRERGERSSMGGGPSSPFYYGRVIAGAGAGACACVGGGTRPTTAPAMDDRYLHIAQPIAQSTCPPPPCPPSQPAQFTGAVAGADYRCCRYHHLSPLAPSHASHPPALTRISSFACCCWRDAAWAFFAAPPVPGCFFLKKVPELPGVFLPSSLLALVLGACGTRLRVLRTLCFVPACTPPSPSSHFSGASRLGGDLDWGATVTLPSEWPRPVCPRQRATGVIAWYCTGTCSAPAVSPRYSTKALYRDEFCRSRTVYMPRSELVPAACPLSPSACSYSCCSCSELFDASSAAPATSTIQRATVPSSVPNLRYPETATSSRGKRTRGADFLPSH